jgi:hypothetical protein
MAIKAKVENKGTQFISEIGTLVYVHLFKPTRFNEESKEMKSVMLVMEKNSKDVGVLKNIIGNEVKTGGLKSNYYSPLKEGKQFNEDRVEEGKEPIEDFEDKYLISFKTDANFKIRIVNGRKETITDESVDGSCWKGRVIGKLKWYKNSKDNYGVTGYLNAVQLVQHSDIQVGGDVSNLFDIVETDEEDETLPF